MAVVKRVVKNFWRCLPKPFFVLAPMADVTDAAFRRIIAQCSGMGRGGGPDAVFTEFTSADGLCSPEGRRKLLINLQYSERERPIVAQIFGARPAKISEAAGLIRKLKFDGLDVNMGCPDRKVEKQGAGAALMKNPKLAAEIIRAAKDGAGGLPVSVKTRLGYDEDTLEEWLAVLLAEEPAAVTVHARTRKEMSAVPAHWERVKAAVEIRDKMKSSALIIGNGDVGDVAEARRRAEETGADGIMIGRAIFGNPWLFASQPSAAVRRSIRAKGEDAPAGKIGAGSAKKSFSHSQECENDLGGEKKGGAGGGVTVEDKLAVLVKHAELFKRIFRGRKNFAVMKKHFRAYLSGFEGARELRVRLMEAPNVKAVEKIVSDFLKTRKKQRTW